MEGGWWWVRSEQGERGAKVGKGANVKRARGKQRRGAAVRKGGSAVLN